MIKSFFQRYGSLSLLAVIFLLVATYFIGHIESWLDEGNYLIKSWNYVALGEQPYGPRDATWYMPVYFYVLGYWQSIWGAGHHSGRLLSVLLGVVAISLLRVLSRAIYREASAFWISGLVFLLTPLSIFYFSTATPMALVSAELMLLFLFFSSSSLISSRWAPLGLGFLWALIYLTRSSLVLSLPLFMIAFPLLSTHPRRGRHAVFAVGVFSILLISAAYILGPIFSFFSTRFPILSPLLENLGVVNNPFSLAWNSARWPGMRGEIWNEKTLGALWSSAIRPHMLLLALNLAAGWHFLSNRELLRSYFCKLQALASLSFLVLFVGHFFASQSYCHSCIEAYVHYFAVLGALAAPCGFFALRQGLEGRIGSARLGTFVAYSVFALLAAWSIATQWPTISRETQGQFFRKLGQLTSLLRRHPEIDSELLVLGGLPYAPQASFLSGNSFSLLSINYHHSLRELNQSLSPSEIALAEKQLNALNLWTCPMMKKKIINEYRWLLLHQSSATQEWNSQISQNFDRIDGGVLWGDELFELYRKR